MSKLSEMSKRILYDLNCKGLFRPAGSCLAEMGQSIAEARKVIEQSLRLFIQEAPPTGGPR